MTLYIGSRQELPIIAFDKDNPTFNTTQLCEDEKTIYKHISLPYVLNFGSDQGCGCGFRHALLDDGQWFHVEVEDESSVEREAIQKNHEELYRYIKTFVSDNAPIEIYGCWNGDFDDVPGSVEEIIIDVLIDKDFYFKERGFYTISNSG
jgi:hypothetical protein